MTILEPDVEQELVAAWEAWDRHPGTGAGRMARLDRERAVGA